VRAVTDRTSNPFDLSPSCEPFVAGYGDANADFHVIGDHPGVHGGRETGIPFTGRPWSDRFFQALLDGGLLERFDAAAGELEVRNTYLSYLHMCVPDGESPSDGAYAELEPLFDAELRAITADVLLPVGRRATAHVFDQYTTRRSDRQDRLDDLHASELDGSGWLVVPVKSPADWTTGDGDALAREVVRLRETDYRQFADLGRFLPDDRPYYVR
jgi:uracil-DNA glycosylase